MTRNEIEHLPRCEWSDRPCTKCGKDMHAYDASASFYDYALLCQTLACENWRKVAFLDAQASDVTDKNLETLDIQHVVKPAVIHGLPDEITGHPVEDWLRETRDGDTRLDYREWVEQRFEDDPDAFCRTCFEPYAGDGDGYDGECPICADRTEADRRDD